MYSLAFSILLHGVGCITSVGLEKAVNKRLEEMAVKQQTVEGVEKKIKEDSKSEKIQDKKFTFGKNKELLLLKARFMIL